MSANFPVMNENKDVLGNPYDTQPTIETIKVESYTTADDKQYGYVKLKYIPSNDNEYKPSILMNSHVLVESLSASNLSFTDFYVNYSTGEILFNKNVLDEDAYITYYATGSLVQAEEINYLYNRVKHSNATPTNTDSGYELGTVWINESVDPKRFYVCIKNDTNLAIWAPIINKIYDENSVHLETSVSVDGPTGCINFRIKDEDKALIDCNGDVTIKNMTEVGYVMNDADGKLSGGHTISFEGIGFTAQLPIVLTGKEISHSNSSGYKHVPSGGAVNKILKWESSGTASWEYENWIYDSGYLYPYGTNTKIWLKTARIKTGTGNNELEYILPTSYDSSSTFLMNDGNGTLTWSDASSIGGFWSRDGNTNTVRTLNSGDNINLGVNSIYIKNLTYSFPSTHNTSNTYLKNDGSGNLSWETISIPTNYWTLNSNILSPTSGLGINTVNLGSSVRINSQTYTFPNSSGNSGDFLQTNGSGTLSWSSANNYWSRSTATSPAVISPFTSGDDLDLGTGNIKTIKGLLYTWPSAQSVSSILHNNGSGTLSWIVFDNDGTLAADSSTRISTQKAVKTYVDTKVATLNFWSRNSTTLSPVNSGDNLSISGNIIGTSQLLSSGTSGSPTTPESKLHLVGDHAFTGTRTNTFLTNGLIIEDLYKAYIGLNTGNTSVCGILIGDTTNEYRMKITGTLHSTSPYLMFTLDSTDVSKIYSDRFEVHKPLKLYGNRIDSSSTNSLIDLSTSSKVLINGALDVTGAITTQSLVTTNHFWGDFKVGKDNSTSGNFISINGSASYERRLIFATNSSPRWSWSINNQGEPGSGANIGSDICLRVYDDTGGIYGDTTDARDPYPYAMKLFRPTGLAHVPYGMFTGFVTAMQQIWKYGTQNNPTNNLFANWTNNAPDNWTKNGSCTWELSTQYGSNAVKVTIASPQSSFTGIYSNSLPSSYKFIPGKIYSIKFNLAGGPINRIGIGTSTSDVYYVNSSSLDSSYFTYSTSTSSLIQQEFVFTCPNNISTADKIFFGTVDSSAIWTIDSIYIYENKYSYVTADRGMFKSNQLGQLLFTDIQNTSDTPVDGEIRIIKSQGIFCRSGNTWNSVLWGAGGGTGDSYFSRDADNQILYPFNSNDSIRIVRDGTNSTTTPVYDSTVATAYATPTTTIDRPAYRSIYKTGSNNNTTIASSYKSIIYTPTAGRTITNGIGNYSLFNLSDNSGTMTNAYHLYGGFTSYTINGTLSNLTGVYLDLSFIPTVIGVNIAGLTETTTLSIKGINIGNIGHSDATTTYGINIGTVTTKNTNTGYGLYIGDVTGGLDNYSIYTNSGKVRFGGELSIGGTLTTSGSTVVSTQTTFNLLNTVTTTLNIGGAADVNIGGSSKTVTVANALGVTGNTTLTGDLAVNGGDITSTSGAARLFNTADTTSLTIGGSASVTIGKSGLATTISGNISVSGTSTLTGNLAFNGSAITSTTASLSIFDTTHTTSITLGANAAVTIGKSGLSTNVLGAFDATGNTTLRGTLDTSGNTTLRGTLNIYSTLDTTGNATLRGTLGVTGNTTLTGDLAVNGGDITSTATTFNLLNDTVTTLNIGGAANISVGSSNKTFTNKGAIDNSGSATIRGTTLAFDGTTMTSTSASLTIFDTTHTTSISLGANAAVNIGKAGLATTVRGTFTSTQAATFSTTLGVTGNTTLTGDLAVNGGDITSTASNFYLLNTYGNDIYFAGNANSISIGKSGKVTTFNSDIDSSGTLYIIDKLILVDGLIGSTSSEVNILSDTSTLTTVINLGKDSVTTNINSYATLWTHDGSFYVNSIDTSGDINIGGTAYFNDSSFSNISIDGTISSIGAISSDDSIQISHRKSQYISDVGAIGRINENNIWAAPDDNDKILSFIAGNTQLTQDSSVHYIIRYKTREVPFYTTELRVRYIDSELDVLNQVPTENFTNNGWGGIASSYIRLYGEDETLYCSITSAYVDNTSVPNISFISDGDAYFVDSSYNPISVNMKYLNLSGNYINSSSTDDFNFLSTYNGNNIYYGDSSNTTLLHTFNNDILANTGLIISGSIGSPTQLNKDIGIFQMGVDSENNPIMSLMVGKVELDGNNDPFFTAYPLHMSISSLVVSGDIKSAGATFGDATNNTSFDSTGHQTMNGEAKVWNDVRIEPVARTSGVNSPVFEKYFDDTSNTSRGVYLYSFDDAIANNEKEVFFTLQMPHDWDSGPIKIHVHWIPSVADTTATPRWGLEYNWKEPGGVFGDTTIIYATGNVHNDTDLVQYKHYITEFSQLTPDTTTDGLSTILIGRLFRNSSDAADTYDVAGNKCGLLYIDAHYQMNSIGSNSEYIK